MTTGNGQALSVLLVADVDPVHVIGGGERMLQEYASGLAARGHRVTVLTRGDGDLPPEETYQGFRVLRHPVVHGNQLATYRSILQEGRQAVGCLLAEQRFDVANIHQPLAGSAVLPVLRSRVPIFYTFLSPWAEEYSTRQGVRHHGLLGRAWNGLNVAWRARMERDVLRAASRIGVLSQFSLRQLVDTHGIAPDGVDVLPGGVDIERFHPVADLPGLRGSLRLEGGPLLFTVRNLEPRMGLESLVEAMPAVAAQHPGVQLLIGGQGSLRSRLEAQVVELNLSGNVRLLGFVPEADLPGYYAASDAFILPTRCLEGFGLVTIEALACGTPVLGTPVGSTPEILSRLDSRLIFKSAERQDIEAGLLSWLGAGETRAYWAGRCRSLAESTYAWPVIIERLEALLRGLVRS